MRQRVYNPTFQNTSRLYHTHSFSGIVHHQVTRTHSVVGIDDKLVIVQRTGGTGLANHLQEHQERSRRRMGKSSILNQNQQELALTKVGLL